MAEIAISPAQDFVASCLAQALHKVVVQLKNGMIGSELIGDQTFRWISRSSFLMLPRWGVGRTPLRQPIGRSRIFRILVYTISMIVNANLSLALAKVEETVSTNDFVLDYNQTSISFDSTSYSDDSNFESKFDGIDLLPKAVLSSSVDLGGVFIPETVWSLSTSTGVQLDRIPSEIGTDLGGALGNRQTSPDFWTQAILGFWTDKNSYRALGEPSSSSVQLQVASCNSNSAERRNLDFCNIKANSIIKSSGSKEETAEDSDNNHIITLDDSLSATIASNSSSASSEEAQPVVEPEPSWSTPALHRRVYNRRHEWSSPAAALTPTIDDPIAPIELPSEPIPPIDDVGPISIPIIINPSPGRPIPETSTGVMLIIGFGMLFLMTRGNTNNYVKRRMRKRVP
jgi:hypothetical protein